MHEVDADAQAPTASTPCQVRGQWVAGGKGKAGQGKGVVSCCPSTRPLAICASAFATCRGSRACPACLVLCLCLCVCIVDMIIGMRQ